LDNLPDNDTDYIWADYIELLCLLNLDKEITQGDVVQRVRTLKDDFPTTDEEVELATSEPSNRDDRWKRKVADWFIQLKYRADSFGTIYPFKILNNGNVLKTKGRIHKCHKIYIFLLLSSNLRCVSKSDQYNLTSFFEYLCFHALVEFLPDTSQAYMFGVSKVNKDRRYSGNFQNKIHNLSEDIGESINQKYEEEIRAKSGGDGGLDLVAWIPFDDGLTSFPIFFGQCTCTQDWGRKQYDIDPSRFNYITYTVPPVLMIFIPHVYRNDSGKWYNAMEIATSVLFDRLRIAKLTKEHYTKLEKYIAGYVQNAIEMSEPIF